MIVFIHLNNDFSGSPKVLRDVIKVTNELNIKNKLYVSNSSEFGFLTDAPSKVSNFWYKRFISNRFLTFISLCLSQIHLFIKLLLDKEITSDSVFYVNTLLPFGAKLYALLTRKRMICHIHEISLTPYLFYISLVAINRHSSDLNIFVSNEHYRISGDKRVASKVLPNAVDNQFLISGKDHPYNHKIDGKFKVTMICGAARYKGIPEFFEIAKEIGEMNKDISFELVINCSKNELSLHTNNLTIPSNVAISSVSEDVSKYYRTSSMIVNLSRPDMWIETFGLTILEAMAFGIPVIAPPVGGPVDIVSEGIDGFLIDCRNSKKLVNKINDLCLNPEKHRKMSIAAKLKAKNYSYENFKKLLTPIITRKC